MGHALRTSTCGRGKEAGLGGTEVGLCLTTVPQLAQQILRGALELGWSCITVPNQSLITCQRPRSGWRRPRGGVMGQDLGRGSPPEWWLREGGGAQLRAVSSQHSSSWGGPGVGTGLGHTGSSTTCKRKGKNNREVTYNKSIWIFGIKLKIFHSIV